MSGEPKDSNHDSFPSVPKLLSRRDFLGLGLGTLAAAFGIGTSSSQQAETTPESEFGYDVTNVEINSRNGLLSITYRDFDHRLLRPVNSQQWVNGIQYSPLGDANVMQQLPIILEQVESYYGDLSEYDWLFLVPGQFFPLPSSEFDFGVPAGWTNPDYQGHTFLGGVQNFNIAGLPNRGEHLNYVLCHENFHTLFSKFPRFLINEDGIRVPISNDGVHLIAQVTTAPGFQYYHPQNDILGGNGFSALNDRFQLSPVHLFTLGLLTNEEFVESYEGHRPYVEKYDTNLNFVERVYYTTEDLIRAFDNPEAFFVSGTSVNQTRIMTGLDKFEVEGNIGENPKKVGIIPVGLFVENHSRENNYIGNGLTVGENTDNFVEGYNSLKDLINNSMLGRVEAEILHG